MNYLISILAGLIQGLTEFLPVSSSGHLVILHNFLDFGIVDSLAFDLVLHWGTMLALLLFFWADIWRYFKAFFKSWTSWQYQTNSEQRLSWQLAIGTLPAAVIGFMLEDFISSALRSTTVVAVMLIVFGVFLYIADRLPKLQKQISDLSLGNAMVIGFAQALALIPGVSRSGITIIAGLTQKLNRETAARFSFLLSIPIVFGAGLKKIIELLSSGELISSDIGLLVVGFLTSALVGMVCIKYFLKFLQRHTLRGFAYYRIGLGLVLLLAAFL